MKSADGGAFSQVLFPLRTNRSRCREDTHRVEGAVQRAAAMTEGSEHHALRWH